MTGKRLKWYEARRIIGMPGLSDWPETLTVDEVVILAYPEGDGRRQALKALLFDDLNSGRIAAAGERILHPEPSWTKPGLTREEMHLELCRIPAPPAMVPTIAAADFLRWSLEAGIQDLDGSLLSGWWQGIDSVPAPGKAGCSGKAQRTHVQERQAELENVLQEIERRAADYSVPFDRSQFPGTKSEFRAFLAVYCRKLALTLPTDNDRLDADLRPVGVKFLQGNHKGKGKSFFRQLFPDQYPD